MKAGRMGEQRGWRRVDSSGGLMAVWLDGTMVDDSVRRWARRMVGSSEWQRGCSKAACSAAGWGWKSVPRKVGLMVDGMDPHWVASLAVQMDGNSVALMADKTA